MLDIRRIRENPEAVNTALQRRNRSLSIDALLAIDVERRQLLGKEEELRSRRNQLTQDIARAKREGQDTDRIQQETKQLALEIKRIEEEKEVLNTRQEEWLLTVPNTPQACVPEGPDESGNVVVKTWGEAFISRPQKNVKPHWEIASDLGLVDFDRGVKIAQSRFSIFRGEGARLERALINFMLDCHRESGYEEISPPFLVNAAAMQGTGQLPKFEADMFRCRDDALFLIPTAEVPVTNMFSGEIIEESQLPIYMTAYTPCFRREAGSAGRDTRGLIRQHQFDKVELVKFTRPEDSQREHEQLLSDAEEILRRLEIPYRVVELCTGDLGFAASRCFDIEVWMPALGVYREISSCSNFLDFQARRASLKYRSEATGKPAFLHTLNGSALAVGRTFAAILENYQVSDEEVHIPEVLWPYTGNQLKSIKKGALSCQV